MARLTRVLAVFALATVLGGCAVLSPTPTATPVPTPTPGPSPTPLVLPTIIPTFHTPTATRLPATAVPTPSGTVQSSEVIAPFLNEGAKPEPVPCDAPGVVFRSIYPSLVAGKTLSFHAYLPPCYGSDGREYPVLYLLHGSIQTDTHWLELGIAPWLNSLIASGTIPPVIVIMPYVGDEGNITSGGLHSTEAILVDDLMPYIEQRYCTWRDRQGRAIGGISRGGYWALMLGFRHTFLFATVGGHSSQLNLNIDSPRYNPLATYATSDLANTRIWLDWGDDDFLAPGQVDLHNRLTEAGVEHSATVWPGEHNDAYWASHIPDYLLWYTAAWPLARSTYPLCVRN